MDSGIKISKGLKMNRRKQREQKEEKDKRVWMMKARVFS